MGDQNTPLSAADARHLLRRTGFGAPLAQVAGLTGLTRGAAADQLLAFKLGPTRFKPLGRYIEDRHNSWLSHMLLTGQPLQEKLVLFWHDHFSTSNDKVDYPMLMGNQNALLRKFANGNFKDFVKAINQDAAMMEFLDTVRNVKEQPNENYARELQELFTLGVSDYNGNRNYFQEDIVQIARAFTGMSYDYRNGKLTFDSGEHDYVADPSGRGPKVIYKSSGNFGASGVDYTQANGESTDASPTAEPNAIVDIIFSHTDSDGKKTVARYIATKLFAFFAQPYPKRLAQMTAAQRSALKPIIDQLIAASGFDTTWNVSTLLRSLFVSDAFYATGSPADPQNGFPATALKSVRWPIDYVVTTLRLLNVKPVGRYAYIHGGDFAQVIDQLENMGQILFEPPSVFGWNWENAWINSATLLARYQFAVDVISARGGGPRNFHPEKLSMTLGSLVQNSAADPAAVLTAVTDVLAVTDQLTTADQNSLINYLTDGGAMPTLDLTNTDTRNRKLNGLFGLILQSPAYQLQ